MERIARDRRAQARAAKGETEDALEHHAWPWNRRVSLWLDALVTLTEAKDV